MTSNNISAGPEKFNVFDSDVSESEADCNEWVSVSTSHTISTTSTLPSHLNLNPKSTVKRKVDSADVPRMPRYDSEKVPATTTPAWKTTMRPAIQEIPPFNSSRSPKAHDHTHHNRIHDSESLTPIALLKRYIPNLTAIYIVSRKSMSQPNLLYYTCQDANEPFTRLSALGTSPISMKASPHTTNVSNRKEAYIRICADCAKPPMTIFCNGTWTQAPRSSSNSAYADEIGCTAHAAVLRHLSSLQNRDPGELQLCTQCLRFNTDALDRCVQCDRERDLVLLSAVLKAVDPFRRNEGDKEKVKIFDVDVPQVCKHVEGCNCDR